MGHESEGTYDDYYNDLSPGGNDVIAVPGVTEAVGCCTTAIDEEAGEMIRGPQGAAAYITVVVLVYAVPIMFFMIVYIFHRSSSRVNEKREMDRQVEKFVEHTIQLQDTWSRDNVKRLKRTIIPRVANSQAKELIERRPSCIAIMHGSNVDLDKFSVSDFDGDEGIVLALDHGQNLEQLQGQGRSKSTDSLSEEIASEEPSTSAGEGGENGPSSSRKSSQLTIARPAPDDERYVEAQSMQTRDLRAVSRMVRIVEEDNSVAWAAQSRAHDDATASSSHRHHRRSGISNVNNSANSNNNELNSVSFSQHVFGDTSLATMSMSDDSNEHPIWIPLSPLTHSPHQAASAGGISGNSRPRRSTKVFQNKAGIVKYWKNLITADKHSSSRVTPRDAETGSAYRGDLDLDASARWQDEDDSGAEPLLTLRRVDTNESRVLYISEVSSGSDQSGSSSDSDDGERAETAAAARGRERRQGHANNGIVTWLDGGENEEDDYAELLFNKPQ